MNGRIPPGEMVSTAAGHVSTARVFLDRLMASWAFPSTPPNGSSADPTVDQVLDGSRAVVLLARLALVPFGIMRKARLLTTSDTGDDRLGISAWVELARIARNVCTPNKETCVRIRRSIDAHQFTQR